MARLVRRSYLHRKAKEASPFGVGGNGGGFISGSAFGGGSRVGDADAFDGAFLDETEDAEGPTAEGKQQTTSDAAVDALGDTIKALHF